MWPGSFIEESSDAVSRLLAEQDPHSGGSMLAAISFCKACAMQCMCYLKTGNWRRTRYGNAWMASSPCARELLSGRLLD
jgi:hypothetical protein